MTGSDKVVAYIKRFVDERGYAPSVREIGAGLGMKSTSHVHKVLVDLERTGKISRAPGIARGIVIH